MTDKPSNPYAFPMGNPEQGGYDGMMLRDWFAGQIIQGSYAERNERSNDRIALFAYRQADAMLKAREAK